MLGKEEPPGGVSPPTSFTKVMLRRGRNCVQEANPTSLYVPHVRTVAGNCRKWITRMQSRCTLYMTLYRVRWVGCLCCPRVYRAACSWLKGHYKTTSVWRVIARDILNPLPAVTFDSSPIISYSGFCRLSFSLGSGFLCEMRRQVTAWAHCVACPGKQNDPDLSILLCCGVCIPTSLVSP